MALVSHQQSSALSRGEAIRLAVAVEAAPLAAALAVLFPEFAVTRGRERPSALAVWSGARMPRARTRARSLGVPLVQLGHGLLRTPPWRGVAAPALSVTALTIEGPGSAADTLSAKRVLMARGWETPALLSRAAAARRQLTRHRVGGDWWQNGKLPEIADRVDAYVLIDQSVDVTAMGAMLTAALAQNPPDKIVLIAAAAQTASQHLVRTAVARGCTVLTSPIDPWQVIRRARRIYTAGEAAGGETGFLALVSGCELYCFGDTFYSGWGVTADHESVAQHPFRRTIDEIFAGACLVATRCLDPYRNTAASFEDVVALLAEWRRIENTNRRIAVCVGMSFWKRRRVGDFLRSAAGLPTFCHSTPDALAVVNAQPGSAIAVWASRLPSGLAEAAARQGTPLFRVEDGFIRSVGLGSDFMPAASLVLDQAGIYYDPRTPSDLERLLRETEFSPTLTARAADLIARLVGEGITKYNLGSVAPLLDLPQARRRILVPGQVEDDLSVRFGSADVQDNRALLARVRAANPDAFILYKPHPDVEAGHRKGVVPDAVAMEFADQVVRDVSTAALLAEIDELHTLTSLTGFEALLRRRRVVVYGRPFYAGWELTTDLTPLDRGRRLTLEELVAGALILYPRYLDPVTRLPCPPEIVIERLRDRELWRPGLLVLARRLQGVLVRRWGASARIRRRRGR